MNEQNLGKTNSYFLARWVFIRFLGVIYLIAFVSLWSQVEGLIGSQGILPAHKYLESIHHFLGKDFFLVMPTVFWLNSSDLALHIVCGLGVLFSIFVATGIAQGWSLFILWFLYLSLFKVGQDFLGFQWDILLLEVGFFSIFVAPWRMVHKNVFDEAPPRLALFLLWCILFKLMFQSGMVKLMSGDKTWAKLTALTYHYMTQPIPNPISWYIYQCPVWFHKMSAFIMFMTELVFPFFIFFTRWGRLIACTGIAGFQVIIFLTGNYCFFNLLTIALCFLLLDDGFARHFFSKNFITRSYPIKGNSLSFPRVFPPKADPHQVESGNPDEDKTGCPIKTFGHDNFGIGWIKRILVGVVALVFVTVMLGEFIAMFLGQKKVPSLIMEVIRKVYPFATINSYGLFAVMTTDRPEIIIEGSNDGIEWKEYEFKWKPGNLKRIPPQVAPHQPRLDWQMWFAALGRNFQRAPWFLRFIERLLDNARPVTNLLAVNPFPNEPPTYIRALLYQYEFTDLKTKKATGEWWQRKYVGIFCPAVKLKK